MIKTYISALIKAALEKMNVDSPLIILEFPKNSDFGDISTNVAMQLARSLKNSPRNIAQEIINNLEIDNELIDKVDIAGAGFINFWLKPKIFQNALLEIYEGSKSFGQQSIGQDKKVLVEYVSANPTGLLHLGHGRNGVIGDTLANLYDWLGYDVTREYYFNNAGNQMRNLAKSIYVRYRQLTDSPDFPMPEDGYFGDFIIDIAKDYINNYGSDLIEQTDENLLKFQKFGEEKNFEKIKKTLIKLNIHQDTYYNENTLYESGKIKALLEDLRKLDLIYDKEDAVWLRLTSLGLDSDRVAVKATGEPTYRLPDIAYHKEKFIRGFDEIVDIFGSDHIATIPDVIATVKALGYDSERIKVVIHQFITLTENGQQVKMSKRSGKSYTLDELIDEVGSDVVRFFLLMRGVNTHLDFDLNLAKEQSEKNPVFYLQYAHARICSIFEKISKNNIEIGNFSDYSFLTEKVEFDLIKKILDFPEVISDSCRNSEPHILSDYLRELASVFHNFYHQCRIIGEKQEILSARLALANVTRDVLRNGLAILGISAPEKM
jgi:arginyl-tRNA synthetase